MPVMPGLSGLSSSLSIMVPLAALQSLKSAASVDVAEKLVHVQPLQDPSGMIALYDVAKSVVWRLPLCDVRGGKMAWYKDRIFLSDPVNRTKGMKGTGGDILKELMIAAEIHSGSILTHFPRHEFSLESRTMNTVIEEVCFLILILL